MKHKMLVISMIFVLCWALSGSIPAKAAETWQGSTDETEYTLTRIEIEDEEVPLAPKIPEEQLFPFALTAIILIILFLVIATYVMECQKYRARIYHLQGGEKTTTKMKKSWNIRKLKNLTKELEDTIAGKFIDEM